jgi:hypothetical protein
VAGSHINVEKSMLKRARPIVLVVGLALLAGCSAKPPAPTVHESMTQVISPTALTIWGVTNAAYNDRGDGLDPSKLSQADWTQLASEGAKLRDGALVLARGGPIVVATEGQAIMGDNDAGIPSPHGQAYDTANAKKVQAWIDEKPALFTERAKILAQSGETIIKASQTKDIKSLVEVTSNLDEVCDGCHQRFWGTDEPPPFLK